MKTYIVLDESGAMHLKNERYFIIGGFMTQELHKVKSLHKRIEKRIKEMKGIDISMKVELKSSKINETQQAMFINELYKIENVYPIAVIVDKHNLTDFVASENMAYNFFVKNLIKYLFKCNIDIMSGYEIELLLDNRNVSLKKLKDLESFLNWEFIDKNVNFKVSYLDSKINREIQMADYIANSYWKKYNMRNETISSKIIKNRRLKVSKFPINRFGVNPSIKELKKNKLKEVVKS